MHVPAKTEVVKRKSRDEQIAERLVQMPQTQRGAYRKAVEGKSKAAAVKSFCYECCGYEREEVKLCTDCACPLWMYRPGRSVSKKAKISGPCAVESTNGAERVI